MRAEQGGESPAHAAVDTERHQAVGHLVRHLGFRFQPLQSGNHVAAVRQLGTGGIGAVLTEAGEPHDDDAGGDPEDDFRHEHHDVVAEAQAALAVAAQEAVDHVAHHPGGEDDEGVDHALDQAEGDHVAIGHVADLVGQHGAGFLGTEALQQSLGYRHQSSVLVPAGGEGVGLLGGKDTHFRHLDTRFPGQLIDGGQQPALGFVAGLLDHLHLGGPFRHRLGNEQGNERAGEAKDSTENQQIGQIQPGATLCQVGIHPQQAQSNAGDHDHRQVSEQEKRNAHHRYVSPLTDVVGPDGSDARTPAYPTWRAPTSSKLQWKMGAGRLPSRSGSGILPLFPA